MRGGGGVVDDDRGVWVGFGHAGERVRATMQQGGGAGADQGRLVRREFGRQARAFATLGGAGDAHAENAAFALQRRFAVGQKTLHAAFQRHKGPGHGAHAGGDAGAMQIAHTIGHCRAGEGDIVQTNTIPGRHAHLTRRDRGVQADHGRGKPKPRSNCAVSNRGRPTTPE